MADTLRIATLVRTENPSQSAAEACRRLLAVVSEWPPGSALEVTVGPGRNRGAVTVQLRRQGSEHPTWARDVRWAVDGIAVTRYSRPLAEPTVTAMVELRPGVEATWQQPIDDNDLADPWGPPTPGSAPWPAHPRVTTVPWPAPLVDDGTELVRAIAASPGLYYRVHLAPSTDVEREMVRDVVGRSWDGSSTGAAAYVGRTIRLRTVLASTGATVPAGVRAVVRRWADHLELADVGAPADVWAAGPQALEGRAIPTGLAYGLLRLPAAGSSAVPGMQTQLAPTRTVPLDPVPTAPAVPVRLGLARTASGARTAAVVAPEDLLSHMYVLGMTGTGKSSLLLALVLDLLRVGVSCTVVDPHGSLASAIAREARPELAQRVRTIRYGDADHPVPLNVLGGGRESRERAISAVVNLIQEQYDPGHTGMVSARWHTWFGLGAEGTCALLGARASLIAVVLMLMSQSRMARLAEALQDSHPELSGRIRRELVDLSGREGTDLFSWAASKLHPWIASDRLRAVLGTGADAVDLGQVMRDGQALVIDLASNHLGRDGARLLGTLWVHKHVEALGRDASAERPHVLVVDEAHLFEHGGLPSLLAEGRKWGMGVVAATQESGRLSRALAGALDANAGSFVALRTGIRDAPAAAARLGGWPVADLLRLPKLNAAAQLSRDGVPTEAFSLELDHWGLPARRAVTAADRERQLTEIEATSHDELWRPHADLVPITEGEIDRKLAEVIDQRMASTTRTERPPMPGQLEQWLEVRARRRVAAADDAAMAQPGTADDAEDAEAVHVGDADGAEDAPRGAPADAATTTGAAAGRP